VKAISIEAWHVVEIIEGKKKYEYRSWPTNHRGKIAIHTKAMAGEYRGHITAVADLISCKKIDKGYAFELQNVKTIAPIIHKGQQRIFNIPFEEESFVYVDDLTAEEFKIVEEQAFKDIFYDKKENVK